MAVHALNLEPVDGPDDPRLADYRAIRDGLLRDRGGFAVESREVVRHLLRERRHRVRSVLVTEPSLRAIEDLLDPTIPVHLASQDTMRGVVGFNFHRGCMAIGERGPALSLDALLAAAPPTLVVCEQLSNPDNVGGVFRNAMAFGVGGVVLSPGCADPLYRKVIRVAMGGTLPIPFAEVAAWPQALVRLREAGYGVVALTTRDGENVSRIAWPRHTALLVGTEGDGLTEAALAHATQRATIPMAPGVDSLNAAVACGIALHAAAARA